MTCFGLPNSDIPCMKMIQSFNQLWSCYFIDVQKGYNMIKDHYYTSILPMVIHLMAADESPMSLMGKVTLQLYIANCKFSHTFIICNRLQESDFFFGIDLQKWYSLSSCWDSDRHLFIQREGLFLTYTSNKGDLHSIAVVKSTLKIPLGTMVPYQFGWRTWFKGTNSIFYQQWTYQEGTQPRYPYTWWHL